MQDAAATLAWSPVPALVVKAAMCVWLLDKVQMRAVAWLFAVVLESAAGTSSSSQALRNPRVVQSLCGLQT
jgi:hypothetical protein